MFVLAGIGMSLVLFCRAEDRWERARKLSITFSMWGLSLGACYLLFLRHLSADQGLLSYWNFSFPPSHLFSVAGVEWFATTFFGNFSKSSRPGIIRDCGICVFGGLQRDGFDNEKKLFLYFMDKEGTTLDTFRRVGAAVYLYDFDRSRHGS